MLDYETLKNMAKTLGRPVRELLALGPNNDPFYAGVGSRSEAAEWFADVWQQYGRDGVHLRRIHYQLVSSATVTRLPKGRVYENTERDWNYLDKASLAARYLDLVPSDAMVDRRNDPPLFFANNVEADPNDVRGISTEIVNTGLELDFPIPPEVPSLEVLGLDREADAVQAFICEVWIEKSTQNDWLVPLCRGRGVNLVTGIGEQSEVRSRELALRSAKYGAPVRVFYISDFDPGGRSMPKALARKVQFTVEKYGLDSDIQIIPLALTPEQIRHYSLPRTPIKDTERRKDTFERIFGVGATELDALEALYPGEMARLLEAELDNFLDKDLEGRISLLRFGLQGRLRGIDEEVHEKYADRISEIESAFNRITVEMESLGEEAVDTWSEITEELERRSPDLSDLTVPRPIVPGKTDRFVLYDSTRNYFQQADYFNAWKDGNA